MGITAKITCACYDERSEHVLEFVFNGGVQQNWEGLICMYVVMIVL